MLLRTDNSKYHHRENCQTKEILIFRLLSLNYSNQSFFIHFSAAYYHFQLYKDADRSLFMKCY